MEAPSLFDSLKRIWKTDYLKVLIAWVALAAPFWLGGYRWLAPFVFPLVIIGCLGILYVLLFFVGRHEGKREAKQAAEFKDWPPYHHPLLGTFDLQWKHREYQRVCDWCGSQVQICLPINTIDQPVDDVTIATLDALLKDAKQWNDKFEKNLLSNMLVGYNEHINESDAPMTELEFLSRVRLETLSVEAEYFSVYYYAGDLFGDHSIEMHGTLDGELSEATEVG